MNRHYFGGTQHAYPGNGDQNRIGLRAVAAAIRYQGDGNNQERSPAREQPVSTETTTQADDRDA